jgi:cytochrome P450
VPNLLLKYLHSFIQNDPSQAFEKIYSMCLGLFKIKVPSQASSLAPLALIRPLTCYNRSLPPLPKAKEPPTFLERLKFFNEPIMIERKALGGQPFVTDKFLAFLKVLYIGSPQVVRSLAAREWNEVRVGWPLSIVKLLGQDSVTCTNNQATHKKIRSILARAIGGDSVDAYLPKIQRAARQVIEEAARSKEAVKSTVLLRTFAFSVILQLVVSEELEPLKVKELQGLFSTFVSSLFDPLPYDIPFTPFSNALRAREKVASFIRAYVDEARSLSGQKKAGDSLISRMVMAEDEDGNKLTDSEIIDTTIALLFAGLDTSATAITNTLLLLQENPDSWTRMQAEQIEIAQHGPHISPSAMQRMPYTEAAIKEGMRIMPPVGSSFRSTAQEFELDGHLVPKDTIILYNLRVATENDPRWKDLDPSHPLAAHRFEPERHMSHEGSKQGTQLLFGIGGRTCPGQALSLAEQLIFFAELARNWTYQVDVGDRAYNNVPFPTPVNCLPIRIKSRWVV